jgi:importin subunit beta-1
LLTNLIATDPSIKRASSNCISEICAVELPRKEWPDIISNLVNNTNNEQIEIKKAAMMTLGYICEALQRVAKNTIESSEMEKILYGICLGLKLEEPNEEIRLIAIKALQDSLLFMDT